MWWRHFLEPAMRLSFWKHSGRTKRSVWEASSLLSFSCSCFFTACSSFAASAACQTSDHGLHPAFFLHPVASERLHCPHQDGCQSQGDRLSPQERTASCTQPSRQEASHFLGCARDGSGGVGYGTQTTRASPEVLVLLQEVSPWYRPQ